MNYIMKPINLVEYNHQSISYFDETFMFLMKYVQEYARKTPIYILSELIITLNYVKVISFWIVNLKSNKT